MSKREKKSLPVPGFEPGTLDYGAAALPIELIFPKFIGLQKLGIYS